MIIIFSVGNMLHLIVEACISRNLIDTSAYLWPGYVILSGHLKDTALPQESPWLNFMQGAPLSDPLKNALISTPASRYMVLYYYIWKNQNRNLQAMNGFSILFFHPVI